MLDVIEAVPESDATASSTAIPIGDAKRVSVVYTRTDTVEAPAVPAGTSTFSATVSIDGTNYVTYNRWIDNVANTNAQNPTRVASKALTTETSAVLTMEDPDKYMYLIVTSTIDTDGTGEIFVSIERES